MCQYSSRDGFATDWHLVHIGSRAVGGAGLIIMEATAVSPEGRITPGCLGIWQDAHVEKLRQIADFAKAQGAVIGIQIAHAGRKASADLPWRGGARLPRDKGGWDVIAPSPLTFQPDHPRPVEMTVADILRVQGDFVAAARRAVAAGFQMIEIHAAHGYLLHSFLSPLSNKRTDDYGGAFDRRLRLLRDTFQAVRRAVPEDMVVGVRLSCADWAPNGIELEDSIATAKILKQDGVDFIDCSSGGLVHDQNIIVGPGYQVPFSEALRQEAGIPTLAVGMITEPRQAADIIDRGAADMVLLARAELFDPYWPLHAAVSLGAAVSVPDQYLRGFPK
jgi:2,4-dienoyl-CoA reductase-like NADH-dependent reductase (Old Yellow Enzyme family)